MTKELLIGLLIFAVVFTIIGTIRFHSRANQERLMNNKKEREEWVKKLSGRIKGRILEHHWEKRGKFNYSQDPINDFDEVFMVTYEFEVNGQTYTGKGEGRPAFQEKERQTICYDPSDPNVNCTLYYYNDQANRKSVL